MIPEKTIVYLAGPMTGYENFNHIAFVEAAQFLRDEMGLAVHNPAKSFGGRKDLSPETYLRHDIGMILTSAAVVFLPGWEYSKGATAEAYVAQALGLPRYLLDGDALVPITEPLPVAAETKEFLTKDINTWINEQSDMMEEMEEGPLIKADGFDNAVMGICRRFGSEPHVVYNKQKVIEQLMTDGLTEEEAEEHFDFNIIGAWVGDNTPGFVSTP